MAGASIRLMSSSFVYKFLSLSALLLFTVQGVLLGSQGEAQNLHSFDASISVFGQSTSSSSGNGIRDSPTESMGGLASVRQTFKPWLGYDVNYSYSRFAERYSTLPYSVQNNVHEATAAYLVEGPKLLFIKPFASVGGGWMVYLPTASGGQHLNQQFQPTLLYELGVNYPLATSHVGVRFQYRGLVHKTPGFNRTALTTGALRQTSELAAGFYLRF